MNHTATAVNLIQYIDDMSIIHAHSPNITFLLGETNSDYINLNMSHGGRCIRELTLAC
jgi:hypothetical protein